MPSSGGEMLIFRMELVKIVGDGPSSMFLLTGWKEHVYTLLCQPRIAKVPLFIPHFDPFCSHSVSLALKFLQCQWCWARKGACNQVWSQVTRELRVAALGCGLRDQWDCHAWGTIKAYGWLLGQLALFQRAWMWLNEADRRYASILEKSRENESG